MSSQEIYNDGKIYSYDSNDPSVTIITIGISGEIPPTHTSGTASDGRIVWKYERLASNSFQIVLNNYPYPHPEALPWKARTNYDNGTHVYHGRNEYVGTIINVGVTGSKPPTHTSGSQTDSGIQWRYYLTYDPLDNYSILSNEKEEYQIVIEEVYADSKYTNGTILKDYTFELDQSNRIATFSHDDFRNIKSITIQTDLEKRFELISNSYTYSIYCNSDPHNLSISDIIYIRGLSDSEYNGTFSVANIISNLSLIHI